ncbi:PilZ domain-containing protein [Mariprofundus erugo]|uniref:PilZ domain-containing protein n=1 Tax=Mariprofundus erugo TaxID=2528639 RepID=UPI001375E91C|nr:PilZ domain-containing protein [Mariprofundus erugo]
MDSDLLERLSSIAAELPEEARSQLLDLMSDWRGEARVAPRIPYTELLSLSTRDDTNHYGHARNVSATGVFIETPAAFKVGEELDLLLTFLSERDPVRLSGQVARVTDDGIGVHFDENSCSRIGMLDTTHSRHALMMRHQS